MFYVKIYLIILYLNRAAAIQCILSCFLLKSVFLESSKYTQGKTGKKKLVQIIGAMFNERYLPSRNKWFISAWLLKLLYKVPFLSKIFQCQVLCLPFIAQNPFLALKEYLSNPYTNFYI